MNIKQTPKGQPAADKPAQTGKPILDALINASESFADDKPVQVVIVVSGGVVQSVHSDGFLHVVLIDEDDLEESGLTSAERDQVVNDYCSTLPECLVDGPELK
jgi:hypothetical protein